MTSAPTRSTPRVTTPRRRRTRRGAHAVLLAATVVATSVTAAPHVSAAPGEDGETAPAEQPVDDPTPPTPPTTPTTPTTVPPTIPTTTPAPATSEPTASTVPTTTVAPAAPVTAPAPTTPPAPAPRNIRVVPGEIGDILATIRYMESRGQYHLPPNKCNASGAYQFIASTWANHGGYAHAYLAPPHVQDERALLDVERFLQQWNNDVSMIPVMWYYPRAAREPALMDVVPVPSAGNVLTIREYQQRWLAVFATISGQPIPSALSFAQQLSTLALPPQPPARDDDVPSIEFPLLGPARVASPDCDDGDDTSDTSDPSVTQSRADIEAAGLCTATAPGIVFGVKLQPVRAAVDAIVTAVDDVPGSGRPISVTLTDVAGRSYVYAGFNDDNPGTDDGAAPAHLRTTALAEVGNVVRAGQIIGFVGDTDPLPVGVRADVPTDASVRIDPDAVAPHIRLTIRELDGTPVDAFGPILDAIFRSGCQIGIGTWSVPSRDGTFPAVTVETTDDDDDIDSEWVITSTGRVTASGWAAQVMPGESCGWSPETAYGPGAAGFDDVPDHWSQPLDLPATVWLDLALSEDSTFRSPILRR